MRRLSLAAATCLVAVLCGCQPKPDLPDVSAQTSQSNRSLPPRCVYDRPTPVICRCEAGAERVCSVGQTCTVGGPGNPVCA